MRQRCRQRCPAATAVWAATLRVYGWVVWHRWHSDFTGYEPLPLTNASVHLNRGEGPNGKWFYLNGSHPRKGGLCVLAGSHRPDYVPPGGFRWSNGPHSGLERLDATTGEWESANNDFDIPGVVPFYSEPGDMLIFAARTMRASTNCVFCVSLLFFLFASYDDSATGAGWSQMLRFRCQRTSLTCGIQSASACAAPTLFKAILKVLRSLNLLGRYPTRQGGRLRCVGPPWHLPCSVLVVVGLAITTICMPPLLDCEDRAQRARSWSDTSAATGDFLVLSRARTGGLLSSRPRRQQHHSIRSCERDRVRVRV